MTTPLQPRFRIGFTGTRKGLTPDQVAALSLELKEQLEKHPGHEIQVHHGDAIGADQQFHDACRVMGFRIVIHPATNQRERAFCKGATDVRPPTDFASQSDAILTATQLLIAAPDGMKERARGSGTWMTVRKARKAGKTIVICYPDGSRNTEVEE